MIISGKKRFHQINCNMLISPIERLFPTTSLSPYIPGAYLSNISTDPSVVRLLVLLKSSKQSYSLNLDKTTIEHEDLSFILEDPIDSLALITMGIPCFLTSTVDAVLVPLIRKQVNSLDSYWYNFLPYIQDRTLHANDE
jgi:hypothetical protein